MTKTRTELIKEENVWDALAPLFTWRGMDVYPLFGAEGEDGNVTEPDREPDEDEEDEPIQADPSSSETLSREDFDRLRKQLSAADKRREDAEKRLKEIDDSKKDELTKTTERVAELEEVLKERDSELAEMRLQNAFLTADTGITWHDPTDALALAERQGYLTEVISEDGKVDAAKLKVKLQELAKAKPHLVKTDAVGQKKETPRPSTGNKVGSKGTTKPTETKLPSRYDRYLNR